MSLRALTFPATRRHLASLSRERRVQIGAFALIVSVDLIAAELRNHALDFGMPVHSGFLVSADRFLGAGVTPTERLQSWLSFGETGWFAWAMLILHVSWFGVPALLTLYIIIARPADFPSYLLAKIALLALTLVVFILLPSKPPWMALPIHRVLEVAGKSPVNADWNTMAAFPSLHVALPALQAIWLRSRRLNGLALVFALYTVATAFMAIFTGEHYLVDAIGGVAVAYVAVQISLYRVHRAQAHAPVGASPPEAASVAS